MNRINYIFKCLWLIGLIILLFLRFHFQQIILQNASTTFNIVPSLWFGAIIPLIMGLYLGLIFISGKSFCVNKPLLFCVSLPCLVAIFFIPAVTTIAAVTSPQPGSFTVRIPLYWLSLLTDHGVLAIFTGATLVGSLIGDRTTKYR